ncbi:MAG: hypothetical protein ABSE84_18795, partial [Isosphaeraceae bacterium]
ELNDAQHHASRVLLKPHLIVRESSGERGGRAKPTGELSMKRSGRAQLAQGARKKVSATPESNGTKGRDEGI